MHHIVFMSCRLGRSSESRTAGQGSLVDEADAALALCRFSMGDAPGAGEMYMEVLQRTGEKHVQVRLGCARGCFLLSLLLFRGVYGACVALLLVSV